MHLLSVFHRAKLFQTTKLGMLGGQVIREHIPCWHMTEALITSSTPDSRGTPSLSTLSYEVKEKTFSKTAKLNLQAQKEAVSLA